MILNSLLSDRNHTEGSQNVAANVLGRHDQNFNRLSIIDNSFLQVILSSLLQTEFHFHS
jgi:hypothetical protein